VNAIDSTKSILGGLRVFNKEDWIVRYPQLRDVQQEGTMEPQRRGMLRRSLSFADDPSSETEVVVGSQRKGLTRSVTLASIADAENEEEQVSGERESAEGDRLIPTSNASDFNILRLDLKLGPHGASNSPASLVSQLEKSSIANLLDERIGSSISHIDKLRLRVEDTSSKVLVTGDLNAGKSTFVNALLRREVMPVDQQPCTTAFCEVHDAAENEGREEVHILKEGVTYDIKDDSTYTRGYVADLEGIVGETQQMIKLYLADSRAPSESLLNNGVVDISLIDAPGLNRDSLKTTAVFARQEEIDVVVFVVSAENHFTLSSKEFLWNASNEKAYLFIVVNKFEQIKNKEKCKKLVLEQIKQLSPRTFDDAEDLVHFVDSAAALQPYTANPAFDDLESSLRSFVLVKRSKSKLQPASTYLSNLLSDIDLLVGANAIVAQSERDRALEDINRVRPILEKMKDGQENLEDGLEVVEEQGASRTRMRTKEVLTNAIDRVGQGKLGVDEPAISMPAYPGLLGLWEYAKDVRKALLASLDKAVVIAEDEARVTTTAGVNQVSRLADEHLPEGVERSRRVFMPEAMFSLRTGKKSGRSKNRRSSSAGGAIVAGGIHGLGIGLAQRPDLLETSFLDLFDAHHQFWVHFGEDKTGLAVEEDSAPSALSVVSVGLGALTMVGGQTLGARGIIEGIVRISDLLGNETARKWAAPVIGAFTIGLTAYFILELPNTIPKTIGRRIKMSLVKADENVSEDEMYVNAHAARISRETRKVLRLASWDLRERFRAAMDERGKEVIGAEEMERKSGKAIEYFIGVEQQTGGIREKAGLTGGV
jgi:mitofusin